MFVVCDRVCLCACVYAFHKAEQKNFEIKIKMSEMQQDKNNLSGVIGAQHKNACHCGTTPGSFASRLQCNRALAWWCGQVIDQCRPCLGCHRYRCGLSGFSGERRQSCGQHGCSAGWVAPDGVHPAGCCLSIRGACAQAVLGNNRECTVNCACRPGISGALRRRLNPCFWRLKSFSSASSCSQLLVLPGCRELLC